MMIPPWRVLLNDVNFYLVHFVGSLRKIIPRVYRKSHHLNFLESTRGWNLPPVLIKSRSQFERIGLSSKNVKPHEGHANVSVRNLSCCSPSAEMKCRLSALALALALATHLSPIKSVTFLIFQRLSSLFTTFCSSDGTDFNSPSLETRLLRFDRGALKAAGRDL